MYRTAFLPYSELFYEYLATDVPNNMRVLQYHDCYEVYLLTSGERYYFINDICYNLKPGDLFIVRPFEMHYSQSLDLPYYARHLLNFSKKHLKSILTTTELDILMGKITSCIIHLNEEQLQEAEFYFKGIGSANGFLATKIQASFLLQLLVFISKCIDATDSYIDTSRLPDVKPEILQAIHYINSHYEENLTLDFISKHVHLSKYYFCRQFSKTVGAGFLEYLTNVRLSKAHQLLVNTKYPLSKIASLTGFSSPVQLSRSFQSVYNQTPTAFRKKAAEEHPHDFLDTDFADTPQSENNPLNK